MKRTYIRKLTREWLRDAAKTSVAHRVRFHERLKAEVEALDAAMDEAFGPFTGPEPVLDEEEEDEPVRSTSTSKASKKSTSKEPTPNSGVNCAQQ